MAGDTRYQIPSPLPKSGEHILKEICCEILGLNIEILETKYGRLDIWFDNFQESQFFLFYWNKNKDKIIARREALEKTLAETNLQRPPEEQADNE